MISKRRAEAGRISLAYVVKNGETVVKLLEDGEGLVGTIKRLQKFLRAKSTPQELYPEGLVLTRERAEQYVAEAVNGSPRVAGVYIIDLDATELSALDISYGWRNYRLNEFGRWAEMGYYPSIYPVYIRGTEPLPVDAIYFESEIEHMDGNLLNFYIHVHFDQDGVFGTHVGTPENDDWLNVYANYDMETGDVKDTLDVYLVRGDGTELCCQYRLTRNMQDALLSKMDGYCKEQTGMGLEEYRKKWQRD